MGSKTIKESWKELKLWEKILIGTWCALFFGVGYFALLGILIFQFIADSTNTKAVWLALAVSVLVMGILGIVEFTRKIEK